LRFAEHYESPKFRNQVFTLAEFKRWYRTTRPGGKFTYYHDWGGFNIPSYAFKAFKDGRFDPLSEQEQLFLDIVRGIKEPFYIIVAPIGHQSTIRHETAHALFYLNLEYRDKVLAILTKMKLRKIRSRLLEFGYCKEVLLDEFNAFLVDEGKTTLITSSPANNKGIKDLCRLFDEYLGKAKK
jgi:uncharacterized protein YifE (UPF0438 family)